MAQFSKYFILILFISLLPKLQADSWSDPSWREMLDSSDVIALIEYTSYGEFRARAKALRVYKGQFQSDEFWISGFSNRFGPIDTVHSGERFIVFLNHWGELSANRQDYWEAEVTDKPELSDFVEGIKNGRVYSVWSPTSGDYPVKDEEVQYDLLQTSRYRNLTFYPIKEFEKFILANTRKAPPSRFQKQTLKKLNKHAEQEIASQYVMMLYLTGFQSYSPIFQTIVAKQLPSPNFALAKLLGQVGGELSRDLLIELLDSENSIVQGEAIRQLSHEDPAYIGPILLAHLDSSGEGGIYPANIMNPVQNQLDGGKKEIIGTLGKIGYKPAIPQLIPLLETEDRDLFMLVVHVLIALESDAYIPYLIRHLENQNYPLIYDICRIISRDSLSVCKPALKKFISEHDRTQHQDYDYTISSYNGLAQFDDQESKDFLIQDCQNFLRHIDSLNMSSFRTRDWINAYLESFAELRVEGARPMIYQFLAYWYGLTNAFSHHPNLFTIKRNLEDSTRNQVRRALNTYQIEEIRSLVFLQNPQEIIKGKRPVYDRFVYFRLVFQPQEPKPGETMEETIEEMFSTSNSIKIFGELESARQLIHQELKIPKKNISGKTGNFVLDTDERFDERVTSNSPLYKFYKYVKAFPNEEDLIFLKAIADSNMVQNEYDKGELNKSIEEIEEKLK